MQALDHAAGYLLTFGINIALAKTITVSNTLHPSLYKSSIKFYLGFQEGGSWEVRTSLAAVGQWIRSLGRIDPAVAFKEAQTLPVSGCPMPQEIQALSETTTAENGSSITAVGHAAHFLPQD